MTHITKKKKKNGHGNGLGFSFCELIIYIHPTKMLLYVKKCMAN